MHFYCNNILIKEVSCKVSFTNILNTGVYLYVDGALIGTITSLVFYLSTLRASKRF